MKLKGKAKFELTNVETGETRVVKEENMVTNAYANLVKGFGRYNGAIYNYTDTSANQGVCGTELSGSHLKTRRFSGGLVLFSGQMNEDPDHMWLTGDDPEMVGVGANIAYIGEQSCAGSYNSTESGPIENGYKYVWDFTTSQANGDIGCACLTSLAGASVGFGFPKAETSWAGRFTAFNSGSYSTQLFEDKYDGYYGCARGYYNTANCTFTRPRYHYSMPHSNSTHTDYVTNIAQPDLPLTAEKVFSRTFIYTKEIELSVFRFPYSMDSLMFNNQYKTVTAYYNGSSRTDMTYMDDVDLLRNVTVKMPSDLAALFDEEKVQASLTTNYYWPACMSYDEGYMYISFAVSPGYTINSGDKIYVWKIDMETFESSWFAITNTTGKTLYWLGYNSSYYPWTVIPAVIVTNNYTVLCSGSNSRSTFTGYKYIIDNATSSTIKSVVDSEGNETNMGSWRSYFVYKDMLYAFQATSNDYGYMYILNLKTGVIKQCYIDRGFHGMGAEYYSYATVYCVDGITYGNKLPHVLYHAVGNGSTNSNGTTGSRSMRFMQNPLYLLTINNLEDIVTKTSAETMKVTYIITESEE